MNIAISKYKRWGGMKRKLKMAALSLCGFLLSPLTAIADNVRISSVYEPATMLLMGAGLIGLAILGRNIFKK
jgi:hypothetical protein